MSFIARLFRKLRNPRGFVGRDLEGNQFFEYPGIYDDPRRTKRVVKYAHGRDMWSYVGGQKRLAVQWTAWLTHTRPHPPTVEELQADLERQRRVLYNAALIAARDREEAARIAASEHVAPHLQAPTVPLRSSEAPKDEGAPATTLDPPEAATPPAKAPQPPVEQRSPWKKPPPDEPHSWQPRASVQRGG